MNKKNKEKVICKTCGKEFEDYRSNERKYCSFICRNVGLLGNKNAIVTIMERECLYCGKKFRYYKSQLKHMFCSKICHNKSRIGIKRIGFNSYKNYKKIRIERECLYCGKNFSVVPSVVKIGRGRYCSKFCYNQSPIEKEKHSQATLLSYQRPRKKPEYVFPNKSEIKLNDIIQKLKVPYKYVGNGEIWIAGKNPDFININGQKKIIELFGEPWHDKNRSYFGKLSYTQTEQGRKEIFAQYGYDTLIIWSKELKNIEMIKQKILDFDNL